MSAKNRFGRGAGALAKDGEWGPRLRPIWAESRKTPIFIHGGVLDVLPCPREVELQMNGHFMKTRFFPRSLATLAVVVLWGQCAVAMAAQDAVVTTTTHTPVTEKETPSPASPVHLSHAVENVLKLSKAKIKEETILAFFANGQSNYDLSADEIIYLRAEGVSVRVIISMLEHGKKRTTPHGTSAPPAVQATAYVLPSNAYVQVPVYVQSSPVYVYSPPAYSYYPYSQSYYGGYSGYSDPYYGGCVGYGYPAVSIGFGFGGGYRGGGYRVGGHHGGRR